MKISVVPAVSLVGLMAAASLSSSSPGKAAYVEAFVTVPLRSRTSPAAAKPTAFTVGTELCMAKKKKAGNNPNSNPKNADADAVAPVKVDATTPTTTTTITGRCDTPTRDEVQGFFQLWNDALATLDADLVAKRYSDDAVLLPTVSDVVRTDRRSIKSYFDVFLSKRPRGTILESYVTMGPGWAQDNGIYEFTMQDGSGDVVKARYTFFYTQDPTSGEWLILHHHSSQMPEEVVPVGKTIDENDVRNLFFLWNDALATGDPEVVANRYSKNAVLLPTVSDVPRTTREAIKDYFVSFLQNQPQGTILESFVQVGNDWCEDSGIYEFAMGAVDGKKVKARYTFLYTYEDGQWKIAHHHSSQMPEEIQPKGSATGAAADTNDDVKAPVLSHEEIRGLFDLWNAALATEDPHQVAGRYAQKSILLPTVSDTPRTDAASITDYFENFLQRKPQGVIIDGQTLAGNGWCNDAGLYEFTMGATGDKVLARYSFVYIYEDNEWKISHHHSSMMPEPMLASKSTETTLSPKAVRELFDRWNTALASKDPKQVAACYTKDAVLLPTVSNTPRFTPAEITDYFVTFLKQEPQGVIKDGVIVSGENWAEDAGVYEFTMGATGDKVLARYSFVYVRDDDDGEWRIAHHHSSAMPEPLFEAGRLYNAVERILGTGSSNNGSKDENEIAAVGPRQPQRQSSLKKSLRRLLSDFVPRSD